MPAGTKTAPEPMGVFQIECGPKGDMRLSRQVGGTGVFARGDTSTSAGAISRRRTCSIALAIIRELDRSSTKCSQCLCVVDVSSLSRGLRLTVTRNSCLWTSRGVRNATMWIWCVVHAVAVSHSDVQRSVNLVTGGTWNL
jgi:hypothetical protein